jgi:hypothetical protein
MEIIKVAVASTDGKHVNALFGKAERFSIYSMGPEMVHIEDRLCEKFSTGDPDHAFDASKFNCIAEVLKDCQKLYVVDIGAVPTKELTDRGLEVIKCSCPIDQIGKCGCSCIQP